MGAEPLVGMALMYGYELVLPILDGATFTLRRIANPSLTKKPPPFRGGGDVQNLDQFFWLTCDTL